MNLLPPLPASRFFSPIVYLPDCTIKASLARTIRLAVIALIVMLAVFWANTPGLGGRQSWYLPAVAILVILLFAVLQFRVLGRKYRAHARNVIETWLAEGSRSETDAAAARFYLELIQTRNKRQRADVVTRFLAAVPADNCRTLVIGVNRISPVDDGTLDEEADAFERRARHARRVPILMMGGSFSLICLVLLLSKGVNPAAWHTSDYLLLVPSFLSFLMVLVAAGVVRMPGTVILAAPRRVQHSTARGLSVFTPVDSVLLLATYQQVTIAALYRNDGVARGLHYHAPQTPGLIALLSRWCLLQTAPLPPDPTPA